MIINIVEKNVFYPFFAQRLFSVWLSLVSANQVYLDVDNSTSHLSNSRSSQNIFLLYILCHFFITGGEKYTFFAPTSQAFLSVIPQDIGDPFVIDDDFRLTMLLRHFSEEVLSEEELKKKTSLTMADTKAKVKITVEKGNKLGHLAIVEYLWIDLLVYCSRCRHGEWWNGVGSH